VSTHALPEIKTSEPPNMTPEPADPMIMENIDAGGTPLCSGSSNHAGNGAQQTPRTLDSASNPVPCSPVGTPGPLIHAKTPTCALCTCSKAAESPVATPVAAVVRPPPSRLPGPPMPHAGGHSPSLAAQPVDVQIRGWPVAPHSAWQDGQSATSRSQRASPGPRDQVRQDAHSGASWQVSAASWASSTQRRSSTGAPAAFPLATSVTEEAWNQAADSLQRVLQSVQGLAGLPAATFARSRLQGMAREGGEGGLGASEGSRRPSRSRIPARPLSRMSAAGLRATGASLVAAAEQMMRGRVQVGPPETGTGTEPAQSATGVHHTTSVHPHGAHHICTSTCPPRCGPASLKHVLHTSTCTCTTMHLHCPCMLRCSMGPLPALRMRIFCWFHVLALELIALLDCMRPSVGAGAVMMITNPIANLPPDDEPHSADPRSGEGDIVHDLWARSGETREVRCHSAPATLTNDSHATVS
jgi:hypothetical protein